jgi:hypothetical protein
MASPLKITFFLLVVCNGVDLEFQLTGKYEENRSIKDISDTKKNRVQIARHLGEKSCDCEQEIIGQFKILLLVYM